MVTQAFDPTDNDGLAEITFYGVTTFPTVVIDDDDDQVIFGSLSLPKYVGDDAITKIKQIVATGGLD